MRPVTTQEFVVAALAGLMAAACAGTPGASGTAPTSPAVTNPSNGTHDYDLALHPASVTQCIFMSQSGQSTPASPPQLADVAATVTLIVTPSQIQFGPLGADPHELTFSATRTGSLVSGTLVGSIADGIWTLVFENGVVVSGSVDDSGRISGSATGPFFVGGGGLSTTGCSSVFSYSLTPH